MDEFEQIKIRLEKKGKEIKLKRKNKIINSFLIILIISFATFVFAGDFIYPNTDSNTNEAFIIKTDKHTYNSFTDTDIRASIENTLSYGDCGFFMTTGNTLKVFQEKTKQVQVVDSYDTEYYECLNDEGELSNCSRQVNIVYKNITKKYEEEIPLVDYTNELEKKMKVPQYKLTDNTTKQFKTEETCPLAWVDGKCYNRTLDKYVDITPEKIEDTFSKDVLYLSKEVNFGNLTGNKIFRMCLSPNEVKNIHIVREHKLNDYEEFDLKFYADNGEVGILDPFVNSSWTYRVNLTINGSMINGTHTDFPILITEDNIPSSVWAVANINGSDIRFSNDWDGTEELAREIVSWNNVTNKTEIWVKVNLTDATSKNITMWYGYADAEDYAPSDTYGAENVWDSNYKFVSHMNDLTTSTIKDSTSNDLDGTKLQGANSPQEVTGEFGYAQDFEADSSESIEAGNPSISNGDNLTIEVRINPESGGDIGYGIIVDFNDNDDKFSMADGGGAGLRMRLNGNNNDFGTILNKGEWYSTAVVVGREGVYRDVGVMVDGSWFGSTISSQTFSGSDHIRIGDKPTTPRYFDGIIDELRISNTWRSGRWLQTSQLNQNTPDLFITEGTPEMTEDTTPPTYSCSFNQTYYNQPTRLSCEFSNGGGLEPKGQYNITLNNTGVFTSISSGNFTSTPQTITYDFLLNDTIGNVICSQVVNASDNAGNYNETGQLFCLTTLAVPSYNIQAWGTELLYIAMKTGAILHFTPRETPLYPCDSNSEGDMYMDNTLHEYCYCNSTNWRQFDSTGIC